VLEFPAVGTSQPFVVDGDEQYLLSGVATWIGWIACVVVGWGVLQQ